MSEKNMTLSFVEIIEDDVPEMTRIMTRAFDDDAQKHLGQERGGPEGYDNGDFFRKWLFGYQETVGYKAMDESEVVGGIIVWILDDGQNILGSIFVDPKCQNQGVGSRMWQFIEARYPETISWRLSTPSWATKNHYFYETKCGFQRGEPNPIPGTPDGEFVYRKEMARE
jgi:GNAT superfamily N-acetyltransferase